MKQFFLLLMLASFAASGQKQGQAEIDSLLGALPALKPDTARVKLLNKISFLYYAYDPKAGINYGQQGLALAQQLQWQKGIANACNAIGSNYQHQNNNYEALEYYQKAYRINEQTGNKRGAAQNLGNIGALYYTEGSYTRALEYLFRTLKIFEALQDGDGIATQLTNIASIYEEQKQPLKALYYDSIALRKYRELGDRQSEALMLGNTGNAYHDLGDYAMALKYDQQSLDQWRALGSKQGIARNLVNISDIYSQQKDYYTALRYQFDALGIYQQDDDINGIGVCQTNIADNYYRIATDSVAIKPDRLVPDSRAACLQRAVSYAQKSIAIHRQTGNINALFYAYKVLADAQTGAGDYKAAIESLLQYAVFKDSVFSMENNKKITSLEQQRELDLRESRIRILTQDNALKSLTTEKQKLTNKVLIGGIAMILIIGVSVTMYFVRRSRSEKLIADEKINTLLKDQELKSVSNMLEVQEEERKRIAADLHDRLGSMLSTVKLYFNSVEQQIDTLRAHNREQYHKATSLLDEACDEVRKISHNLVSGELVKFGLVSALMQLKETIEGGGLLKMQVLAFRMDERLDSATEISLYRIVQELMNNILKHARAGEVTIQLNKVANNLNIVVEDNGVGYDVAAARAKDGMGLRNMETRVRKLRGVISFDSVKGRGATTIIDLPV